MSFFKVKIKFKEETQKGLKTTTLQVLVEAVSFTDAESTIINEYSTFQDFNISGSMSKYNAEVHTSEGATKWFIAKVAQTIYDDNSGKVTTRILVDAENPRQALDKIDQIMVGSVSDYRKIGVQESPFAEILKIEPLNAETQPENYDETC